jgi:hypothetical protein
MIRSGTIVFMKKEANTSAAAIHAMVCIVMVWVSHVVDEAGRARRCVIALEHAPWNCLFGRAQSRIPCTGIIEPV